MRVAIAYLTKDRCDLTRQTYPALAAATDADVHWYDGSRTAEGRGLPTELGHKGPLMCDVIGGPDAAIVQALSNLLNDPASYTHIGILENDVLLADDWFDRVMRLFAAGFKDGLEAGAVSARAYEDRVLIQRDGYAVMHNLGAGMIIFTRHAARITLDEYRTGYWPNNREIFEKLSGVDIGRFAAFRGADHYITADWHFDTALAAHGYASLACTPALCTMVGQEPPLDEQGLALVTGEVAERRDEAAFATFKRRMQMVRAGRMRITDGLLDHHRPGDYTIFPHALHRFNGCYTGEWETIWTQGYGPFTWRAAEPGGSLSVQLYGPASLVVSADVDGASVEVRDYVSSYRAPVDVPNGAGPIALTVPGAVSFRQVSMRCSPGIRFHGIQTPFQQPQRLDRNFVFTDLAKVR